MQKACMCYAGDRLSIAPRICILGGGFGGLYTAVRLESLLWPQGSKPQVTLIDQSERFVFKPLLYELLNGGASADEVAPFFTKLLAPYSTNFIQVRLPSISLSITFLLMTFVPFTKCSGRQRSYSQCACKWTCMQMCRAVYRLWRRRRSTRV